MKNLTLLFITFISLHVYSQDSFFGKPINDFQIDPFGNVFIQKENKIIKIKKSNNKKLESIFLEYGKIKKIITKNPLRIIVFFEDSQTIVFLDKNLNKLNMELNLQSIQENIISDIESHSNLIFLLSEKSNELCVYDFKSSKIKNCKSNLKIKKKEYLKLFFDKELFFLINDEKIQILNSNLKPESVKNIKNCEKIFFSQSWLYLKTKNKLYKSNKLDNDNLIFIKNMENEKDIFFIQNDVLFMINNKILIEENLR